MQRPAEEEAVTPKELRELADMADHIRAVEVGAGFPDWLQDLLDMAAALRDHADLCEALDLLARGECVLRAFLIAGQGPRYQAHGRGGLTVCDDPIDMETSDTAFAALLEWWRARKGTR